MLRNDDTYKTPAGDADMARINASAKALSELIEAGNELSAMETKMRRALDALRAIQSMPAQAGR